MLPLTTIIEISYASLWNILSASNINSSKHRWPDIKFKKKLPKPVCQVPTYIASLPDHSHKARGKTKQHTATFLRHNNKLTYLFWFQVYLLRYAFHLQFSMVACFFMLGSHTKALIFHINTFLRGAYLDTTKLFLSYCDTSSFLAYKNDPHP